MVYGNNFFDYIAYEVPEVVEDFFPISDARDDRFITGLSMGSYGALKIGLALPERYSAIGALSSGNHAYMPEGIREMFGGAVPPLMNNRLKLCWGVESADDSVINTKEDVFWLAQQAINNWHSDGCSTSGRCCG